MPAYLRLGMDCAQYALNYYAFLGKFYVFLYFNLRQRSTTDEEEDVRNNLLYPKFIIYG